MIGAVVLAAGAATRFGAPKQQLLIGEVLARLREAPVDEIVVVSGAHDLLPCVTETQGNNVPGRYSRQWRDAIRRPALR